MSEFRLQVANVVLSLDFENDRESRAFGHYFRRTSVDKEPDIWLSIRFQDNHSWGTRIPNSLFLTKTGNGNGFSLGDGLIEGRFSPVSGEGEVKVERIVTRGGYARIYEQFFYQAYRSAAKRKGVASFLLHSCGVIRGGKGYVFTGKSGSGKSTVARLSAKHIVLNDEITTIDLSGHTPILRDTPFNGFFRRKTEGSADLAGILLLEQAQRHRLTKTSDLEDIKTFSRELIPPVGLETPFSPSVYMEMFDWAKKTSERVPLYRMEFTRDAGFWLKIDEIEGA